VLQLLHLLQHPLKVKEEVAGSCASQVMPWSRCRAAAVCPWPMSE
jgi:hypothetical protein